jgi:hypothetical protein
LLAGSLGTVLASCKRGKSPVISTITSTITATPTGPTPVVTITPGYALTTEALTLAPSGGSTPVVAPGSNSFILSSPEVADGGALPRDYT